MKAPYYRNDDDEAMSEERLAVLFEAALKERIFVVPALHPEPGVFVTLGGTPPRATAEVPEAYKVAELVETTLRVSAGVRLNADAVRHVGRRHIEQAAEELFRRLVGAMRSKLSEALGVELADPWGLPSGPDAISSRAFADVMNRISARKGEP